MRSLLATGTLVATIVFGCSTDPVESPVPPLGTQPVPVWFSEIEMPASIGPRETLVVLLSGSAGPDLCHQFDRLTGVRGGAGVEISGYGLKSTSLLCPDQPAFFTNQPYVVEPPFALGPFVVRARQPDGSRMERTVIVVAR